MRKYIVRTEEISNKEYVVWAKDEDSINVAGEDGDEYWFDLKIIEVKKIYDEEYEDEGQIEYCDQLKDDRATGDLPE